MPDSVKLSSFCFFYSRCFFQADNIVMWSRFFSWWSLYLSKHYSTEGYSPGSAGQRQCGGGLSMWKPSGSWGMFFSNSALMRYSNWDKDAYIIPLTFFGDKHTAYKFQLWIWDPLWGGKQERGQRWEKSSCMILYS